MTKFVKDSPIDTVFINHDGLGQVTIYFCRLEDMEDHEWEMTPEEAVTFGQYLIDVGQEALEKIKDD